MASLSLRRPTATGFVSLSARRLVAIAIAASLTALSLTFATTLHARATSWGLPSEPRLPGADGLIWATAVSGNTLFIGGEFTHVGPMAGTVGIVSKTNGDLLRYLDARGTINAMAPDGAGGWYVGGNFYSIAGTTHFHLAHVLSDGSISSWNPSPNDNVYALLVVGNTLYVGGGFGEISGLTRGHLAAYDRTTEALSSWNPLAKKFGSVDEGAVYSLAAEGSTIYVGGDFHECGGQSRTNVAAVDAAVGTATGWAPGANGIVSALAVGTSAIYVGGTFTTSGGFPRSNLAAVNKTTGVATSWNPGASATVRALLATASTLYVAGDFHTIAGQPRRYLAALDAATAAATAWDPNPNASVHTLVLDGSSLLAAGLFSSIGGQSRRFLAGLDTGTGAATAWNPEPNQVCYAIALDGTEVGLGGTFYGFRWPVRNRAASVALDTRQLTAWDPNANFTIFELVTNGSVVYLAGGFTSIGGQARQCLAAIDATTGAATGWNPNPAAGGVSALALNGNTLYVGGSFTSIGGQARNRLATIDATTALALPWNPNVNNIVDCIALSGSTVYVGGTFTSVGGQPRSDLAAIDAVTGAVAPWIPEANAKVRCLLVDGATVYAGGDFTAVGGRFQKGVAALDATTGAARVWNPGLTYVSPIIVFTLALDGGNLYIGGAFDHVAGQPHAYVAAVSVNDAQPTVWDAGVNYDVLSLSLIGSEVLLGGNFTDVRTERQNYLGEIPGSVLDAPENPQGRSLLLEQNAPNPARLGTWLRFSLPAAAEVSLSVYDVTGRELSRVVRGEPLAAGMHRLRVDTSRMAPGVYLVRLDAGSSRETRRMVVAH